MSGAARSRIEENPFHVLGLAPTASRADVEREGQKLLGMLELGLAGAAAYATPLGARVRSAETVRAALAELRDPQRRLIAELWARLPAAAGPFERKPAAKAVGGPAPGEPASWAVALGWRRSPGGGRWGG
jgi:hypothetical protein